MPKLQFDDGSLITISDKQADALSTAFAHMAPTDSITINGKEYLRSTILGVIVPNLRPTPPQPKPRHFNEVPKGMVLPERLQKLFDAGENIDWYFYRKKR